MPGGNFGSSFPAGPLIAVGSEIDTEDFDGDGVVDLIATYGSGTTGADLVAVLRGTGGGFAYEPFRTFIGAEVEAYGDLDGDGDLDGFGSGVFKSRRFHGPSGGIIRQYGSGVAGTAGAVPVLGATGPVHPGSTSASLRVRRGLGGAAGVLAVAAGETELVDFPLPGLTALVDPILFLVPIVLDGPAGVAGAGDWDLDTSGLMGAVAGQSFYHQAIFADAGAASGWSTTNGLEIRYGF